MDTMWLTILALLGLGVRVGQTLQATGMSRSKNAAGAVARAMIDLCLATLAFWAIGSAIMHQEGNRLFGVATNHLFRIPPPIAHLWLAHAMMVLIGTGLIGGVLAERSRFRVTGLAAVMLAGVVIPIAGMWAWNGWLHDMGFIDVAGASVVHVTAGLMAATGAWIVGPRAGKYNRDGSSNMIPGHSLPLAATGVMVMTIAWGAYVAAGSVVMGGTGVLAVINTLLAAASAGATAYLYSWWRYGKVDFPLCLGGLIGGLISVTGAAAGMPSFGAVITGAVAGLAIPCLSVWMDTRLKLDDPTGTVSAHIFGGAWGILAAGAFAPAASMERFKLVGVQTLGLIAVAAIAILMAILLFKTLAATIGVRSKESDEYDGLDLSEHDLNAYPDFQQTMIKSYHLREA